MAFDNVYEAITENNDEVRWAFGTGFADPLAGVDTAVPAGVDGADLAAYCLALADDALVMSHRLQEWVTNAPELEEELALANIALDLLGQARLLYTRAGQADGTGRGEDAYAFGRAAAEFRNVRLVEPPNGDFAWSMARLLLFSTWRLALLTALTAAPDPVLAAIAAKGVKEVAYHRDHAAHWVIRLGDGTEMSHARMRAGLATVWPWLDELFVTTDLERRLGIDPAALRAECDTVLHEVLTTATLTPPPPATTSAAPGEGAARGGDAARDGGAAFGGDAASGVDVVRGAGAGLGRGGAHTGWLGEVLAELQSVARADPEAVW